MEINNDKQINNTDVIGLGVKSMNKEDDLFDIKKSLENMEIIKQINAFFSDFSCIIKKHVVYPLNYFL